MAEEYLDLMANRRIENPQTLYASHQRIAGDYSGVANERHVTQLNKGVLPALPSPLRVSHGQ